MNEQRKVEFTPPKDWQPPEGAEGEFDLVCSFRATPEGKLCMTKLGETEMPGYDEPHKENKPDYGEYHRGMMEQSEKG